MRNKRQMVTSIVVGVAAFALPSMYNACSQIAGFQLGGTSSVASSQSASTPVVNAISPSAKLGLSVLNYQQVVTSASSLLGVPIDSTTASIYNTNSTLLLETFDVGLINAPMWITVTDIDSQLCQALVTKEMAMTAVNRTYFGSIDFTQPIANITDAEFLQAMSNFAAHAWGRALSANETTALTTAKQEFVSAIPSTTTGSGLVTQNQDLQIFGCTAMMASLESITL